MHACMHTCTCMLNMLNMDASMVTAICNFYTCINVCVCVCACTCMCVCVGTPPHAPRCPPTHLPPPQSCREPKTPKFNKSWTNRDNSILFEDSLPLNIPELIWTIADHPGHPPPTCLTPQSQGNPNWKNYNNSWTNRDNSILFEDCDPWTFLHTYRLGLMCRWGDVLFQMALLCFLMQRSAPMTL